MGKLVNAFGKLIGTIIMAVLLLLVKAGIAIAILGAAIIVGFAGAKYLGLR